MRASETEIWLSEIAIHLLGGWQVSHPLRGEHFAGRRGGGVTRRDGTLDLWTQGRETGSGQRRGFAAGDGDGEEWGEVKADRKMS